MRFNLVRVFPQGQRSHGLNGYAETIETIQWGLESLGHDVTVRTNFVAGDRTNVIFGFQALREVEIDALPKGTIVYNLEQLANVPAEQMNSKAFQVASRFQIWDYSTANLENWRRMPTARPAVHVPIGWSPTIRRIIPAPEQDIDVLFYGLPSDARTYVINELARNGVKIIFACGFYGQARDAMIARSRLVLNLNRYEISHVFEVVRVSYLLANGKAVVSDVYSNSAIEPDFLGAVAFAPVGHVVTACMQLLADEPSRRRLELRGPQVMQQRDIRPILTMALAASDLQSGSGEVSADSANV